MNVVVTTLLTSSPDPQRGHRWKPDPSVLRALVASVTGAEVVVLHDEPLTGPLRPWWAKVHTVQVPPLGNPYHARWRHLHTWLAEQPSDLQLFAVDGTDVEMLHEPWGQLEPDHLYVGSEQPGMDARGWLLGCHPSFDGRLPDPVLNAGIVGGQRAEVAGFVAEMVDVLADCQDDLTDMAAINHVCSEIPLLVTGPTVHTRLHGHEDAHPTAWWRHK